MLYYSGGFGGAYILVVLYRGLFNASFLEVYFIFTVEEEPSPLAGANGVFTDIDVVSFS